QCENGLTADTRYGEMEDGLYEHHSKCRQMHGKQSNGSKECVHDGIDNPALIQNDVDCPRKADQKRGVGHRPKSFDKCLCCSGEAQLPNQSGSNSHQEEQRRHLLKVPPQSQYPEYQDDECDSEHQKDEAVPKAQWAGLFVIGATFWHAVAASVAHCPPDPDA